MTIANRTAHFRRLISENLGVRGSRVSIAYLSQVRVPCILCNCHAPCEQDTASLACKACGRCGVAHAREVSELFACRIWLLGPSLAQLHTSSGSSLNRLNSKRGCAANNFQYAFQYSLACFGMQIEWLCRLKPMLPCSYQSNRAL